MSGFSSSKSSMILSISSTFVGNVYCQYVISVLSESPDSPEQPVTNKSPAITAANQYFFMDKFFPFINFLLAFFVSGVFSSNFSMILSISSTFVGNVYCQYVISVLSESPDSPEQPVTNKSPAITAANKYFFMDKFLPFINFLLALFVWPRINPK